MNAKLTLMALGLLAAWPVVAADQPASPLSTNSVATASFAKTQIDSSIPAVSPKLEPKTAKLEKRISIGRTEGMSSLPWPKIVSRQPDIAVFHGTQSQEPIISLSLFSW